MMDYVRQHRREPRKRLLMLLEIAAIRKVGNGLQVRVRGSKRGHWQTARPAGWAIDTGGHLTRYTGGKS